MQPVATDVACSMVYGCMRAPGVMRPWFDFWFWRYMHCLLVYIVCSPTYPFFLFFLTYLLPYLSFPLRTDPLCFQARCRKRQLNLALVFCVVVHFFWSVNACFCCVRFSFFLHTRPRDWLSETCSKLPILCWVGRKTTTQSISLVVVLTVCW